MMTEIQDQILSFCERQIKTWDLARLNYSALKNIRKKIITINNFPVEIQFNPGRKRSTLGSSTKKHDECFLCMKNLPSQQEAFLYKENFIILCNPFPVFSNHITIASKQHIQQSIEGICNDILSLTKELTEFILFYNGPNCGASIPEHLHFQAGIKSEFPIYRYLKEIPNKNHLYLSDKTTTIAINNGLRKFDLLIDKNLDNLLISLKIYFKSKSENVNILMWYENKHWHICLFRRKKHRPDEFYMNDDNQLLISPAAVEMAGLIITPREEDFEKITKENIISIYKQV